MPPASRRLFGSSICVGALLPWFDGSEERAAPSRPAHVSQGAGVVRPTITRGNNPRFGWLNGERSRKTDPDAFDRAPKHAWRVTNTTTQNHHERSTTMIEWQSVKSRLRDSELALKKVLTV